MKLQRRQKEKGIGAVTAIAFGVGLLITIALIPFTTNIQDQEGTTIVMLLTGFLIGSGVWLLLASSFLPSFSSLIRLSPRFRWLRLEKERVVTKARPAVVLFLSVLSLLCGVTLLLLLVWSNYQ